MFNLVRTLPDGKERTQGPVSTKREAATLAAYVLTDNGLATKRYAQTFARILDTTEISTPVKHEASGYVFRIEAAVPALEIPTEGK